MARARSVGLRLLLAHALAYPVAVAWALGSIPLLVVGIASATGTSLDDRDIVHRVLLRVAWPAIGSFGLMHVAGAVWAFARDDAFGRRVFLGTLALLGAIAVVVGGASWLWLVRQ